MITTNIAWKKEDIKYHITRDRPDIQTSCFSDTRYPVRAWLSI